MKRTRGKKQIKAFTLIELLVVVAIISVLAAILFPVFARAKENARRASCMNNLKQIGLGVVMYAQDYDEAYPLYVSGDVWDSPSSATPYGSYTYTPWEALIEPYVKSFQVFYCPSSTSPVTSILNGTYGANEDFFKNSNTAYSMTLSTVQSPASTFMIMDAGSYAIYPSYAITASIGWNYIPGMGDASGNCSALDAANPT